MERTTMGLTRSCGSVTCSGVFTLLQHDRHRGSGVRSFGGVLWSSEEGGERRMDDIHAGVGGATNTEGGGTP